MGGSELGGGESQALPNIKAMGEKKNVVSSRELHAPSPPSPRLSPLFNPTSIKAPTLSFPVRLCSIQWVKAARARGRVGLYTDIPLTSPRA